MNNMERCAQWVCKNGPVCITSVAMEFSWPKWRANRVMFNAQQEGLIRCVSVGGVTLYTAPIAVKPKKQAPLPSPSNNSIFSLGRSLRQGYIERGQLQS